jgi:hypothetical protein
MTLSDRPQMLDEHTWYYEERAGLTVEIYIQGIWNRTDKFVIPWKKLRISLARRERSLKEPTP